MLHGDLRYLHQSTISRTIKRVSIALAERSQQFIKIPLTENELRENARKFNTIANFPGVLGCVDCTHIPIVNPGGNHGEVYRNRKRFFSINVQV